MRPVDVNAAMTRGAIRALDLTFDQIQAKLGEAKEETREKLQAEIDQLSWMRLCALSYKEQGTLDEVFAYLRDGGKSEVSDAA